MKILDKFRNKLGDLTILTKTVETLKNHKDFRPICFLVVPLKATYRLNNSIAESTAGDAPTAVSPLKQLERQTARKNSAILLLHTSRLPFTNPDLRL